MRTCELRLGITREHAALHLISGKGDEEVGVTDLHRGETVLARAVTHADGSALCWLWVAVDQPQIFGVVPVLGNPCNVHAAVHWLGRLRAEVAAGSKVAAVIAAQTGLNSAHGQVSAEAQTFASLAALRAQTIATD